MLVVLLIWLYMLPVFFITGFGLVCAMDRTHRYICANPESYILAGLGAVTIYSEIFSLIYKVGLLANIVLVLLVLSIFFMCKRKLAEYLIELKKRAKPWHLIAILIITIIFAYGASHGYIHYDSDLYHAQSIHWIEDYGVVKGLGNIHTRLAYNSAAFCLTALFSMSFFGGASYHVCAGFLALIVFLMSRKLFIKGELFAPKLSNACRLLAIYYVFIIFDEMVSPESDYFMVLSVIALMILLLELMENKVNDTYPYCMLSVFTLVIISFKISGALICLVSFYAVYLLLKDKDIRGIVKYLITGVLFVAPFLVRSVILSGYLVYPMASIDIFDFDFKIPKEIAVFDNKEIQVYGRGYLDITRYGEPLDRWIGDWFRSLGMVNKLSFVLALISLLLVIIYLIVALVKKDKDELKYIFIMGVSALSFTAFILTSPNIRYGCIFLWLLPLLSLTYLYIHTLSRIDRGVVFKVFIGLFCVYKIFSFSKETITTFTGEYLIKQQDYNVYSLSTFDIGGYTFYMPVDGDRVGYDSFPAVPYDKGARLITDDIKDGFILN